MGNFGKNFGSNFGSNFGAISVVPPPVPAPEVVETPWGGIYKPTTLVGRYRTFLRRNDRYIPGQIMSPVFRNQLHLMRKRNRKP